MEYTEANNTSFLLVSHMPPFILGPAAEGAGVPFVLGQYRILVVEYYYVPSPYLAFQIDRGNNFGGVHQADTFSADFLLEFFPDWI